jgi:glucose-1-phosphate thymidylyltransferase
MTRRALVLARGLGTRMRSEAPGAALDPEQQAAADAGMKAFMPVGRPFLDFILSSLADAGLTTVGIVIGPEHEVVRRYYERDVRPSRLTVEFVVQPEARGTADAVLAAERWTADEPFVVVNGDNYYPQAALSALAGLSLPGLVAFSRQGLVNDGHIDPERILRFALLDLDGNRLRRIVEKPDQVDAQRFARSAWVSMNCWRFDDRVFESCRRAPLSPRGEYELPLAVQQAIDDGRFPVEAVFSEEGVLDLSGRADVAAVARRLASVDVRL